MRKSKFSEVQIAAILKEAEAGIAMAEVARNHGINAATFYQRRSKYGGTEVLDLQRMRELEQGNARLKRIYADLSLENSILKDALTKKVQTPGQRRNAVCWAIEDKQVSQRRACRILGQARTTQRWQLRGRSVTNAGITQRSTDLTGAHPAWRCPQLHRQLRQEGHVINHKRTRRMYREQELTLRRRRLVERERQAPAQPLSRTRVGQ